MESCALLSCNPSSASDIPSQMERFVHTRHLPQNNLIMHVKDIGYLLNTAVYLELDMHDQVLMLHCVIMPASEAEN